MSNPLTHWGRVTQICVSKLNIIGSDNGLSPGRRQAIIWTNAGILSIGTLETNFNQILIEIDIFLFNKMHLKMPSGKWRPFCLGLNVLTVCIYLLWSHGNKWGVKMIQWLTAMIFFIDTDVDYIHAWEYKCRAIAIDLYVKMGRFRVQIIQKVCVSLRPTSRKYVTN